MYFYGDEFCRPYFGPSFRILCLLMLENLITFCIYLSRKFSINIYCDENHVVFKFNASEFLFCLLKLFLLRFSCLSIRHRSCSALPPKTVLAMQATNMLKIDARL